jgi:multicomponent Na+:H+ antiporter subunit B
MMERTLLMRSIPAAAVALLVAGTLFLAFVEVGFGEEKVDEDGSVAGHYIENGTKETGSSNLVTSVVVNYRGFDTLGEVTVLFLAATGVGALIAVLPYDDRKGKKGPDPSFIMTHGGMVAIPVIALFGTYVFLHGHLSPGGGFQGGVIIATAFLLYIIVRPGKGITHQTLSFSESVAGLSFVGLGLIGLAVSSVFLDNVIEGYGELGDLVSGGLLPLIYIAIGVKVGSELSGLVSKMRGDVS